MGSKFFSRTINSFQENQKKLETRFEKLVFTKEDGFDGGDEHPHAACGVKKFFF